MDKDSDLAIVLTRITNRISSQMTVDGSFSQTPQLQIFKHKKLMVYSYPLEEGSDGKQCGDPKQVINVAGKDFYTWRSHEMLLFRRGRALIFSDLNHSNFSKKAETSFKLLDFETRTYGLKQLETILRNVSSAVDCGLQEEGCFAVCILARLIDNKDDGLTICSDGVRIPANELIKMLIGVNCRDLSGKPKLFFFLDSGGQEDDRLVAQSAREWEVPGNNHAEIFTFVGVGEHGKFQITSLLDALQNPLLKKKNVLSLQEVVVNLIRQDYGDSASTDDPTKGTEGQILPQVSSTLHHLLDFPPCKNAYIRPLFTIEGVQGPVSFEQLSKDIAETAIKTALLPKERWRNRSWLVSAPAGIGKSAATNEMARELAELLPDYLIIKITLMQMCNFFLEVKDKVPELREFLKKALEENEIGLEKLEEKYLKKEILVLIDGFDEIWAYEEVVLKFLRDINAEDFCLWITTRPHQQSKLDANVNKLNKLEINPMSREQQVQLLKTMLYKNVEECEKLLKIFKTNKDKGSTFTGTPLQLKMVAEIADRLVDTEGSITSLTSLYYQFVFSKVDSAILKYNGTDTSKPNYLKIVRESVELLMKAACNYFYRENLPSQELKLLRGKQDDINQLGIATVTFDGKKLKSIYFVHQTYAEFMLSLFFLAKAGHFTKEHERYIEAIEENDINLSSIFLRNEFEQVRFFIDGFFIGADSEPKILKTKLDDCCEKEDFKSKSSALMAYVCKEGLARLFNLLFESEYKNTFGDIEAQKALINTPFTYNFRNKEYKYYPLYAACFTSEELALHLIDLGADISLLDPDKCLIEDKGTILHLAAKRGLSKIIEKVLDVLPRMSLEVNQNNQIPLDIAAEKGHFECVKVLIERAVPENRMMQRKRILGIAAEKGNSDMVFYLMGDDLSLQVDLHGTSPLYSAAEHGHVELMQNLIAIAIDVNVEDAEGYTPVHAACRGGSVEALILLYHEHGADLKKISKKKKHTPLHIAVSHNKIACVEFLLNNEVEVDAKDAWGETPYHFAAAYGYLHFLEILENAGANIYAKSVLMHKKVNNKLEELGRLTALDRASLHGEIKTLKYLLTRDYPAEVITHSFWLSLVHHNDKEKVIDVMNAFFEIGFSVDADLKDGKTPMIVLAEKSKEFSAKNPLYRKPYFPGDKIDMEQPFYARPREITFANVINEQNYYIKHIQFLISKGANVNAKSKNDGTALHIAAGAGDLALMLLLLESGAEVNSKDIIDQIPLHEAASNGHLDAVRILVSKGATVNAQSKNFSTPLLLAVKGGQSEVVRNLLESGADTSLTEMFDYFSPIAVAANSAREDLVDMILTKVAPDRKQHELDAALYGALRGRKKEFAKKLIDRGANPTSDNICCVPLSEAVGAESEECVHMLLEKFEDEEIKKKEASVALLTAVKNVNLPLIKLLVERAHADINATDSNGTSAVLMATIRGNSDIVSYFLQFDHLDLVKPSQNGNIPRFFLYNINDNDVKEKLDQRIKEQLQKRNA